MCDAKKENMIYFFQKNHIHCHVLISTVGRGEKVNFLTVRLGMTETEVRINLAENLLDYINQGYKSDRSGKPLAKWSEQILSRC